MKIFFTIIFLFLLTISYSQNDSTSIVIGLEAGSIFNSMDNRIGYGYNYSYGVSIEYPKNKFSFGLAGLRKNYGERKIINYTGESITEIVREELIEYFYYNEGLLRFDYLSLSTRLIYRLPCNCAYIYGAYDAEFLHNFSYLNYYNSNNFLRTKVPPKDVIKRADMKKINKSLELGFGLKAHFSKRFRLNMRFTYGITQLPSQIVTNDFTGDFNYMKINLGFQYALKK